MRYFSDFEKEIVRELVREKEPVTEMGGYYYYTADLGRLFYEKLSIIHLEVIEDGNMNKVVFANLTVRHQETSTTQFQANNSDNADIEKEEKKEALERICKEGGMLFDFVYLIKYLESNWLLGLSPIAVKGSTDTEWTMAGWTRGVGSCWKRDGGEISWYSPFPPYTIYTTLSKDILRYAYSQYYPSQELRELVANDFKSNEQMQLDEAKMQTRYSRISVWLALVAVILAVMPLISKHSHPLMEWLCKLLRGVD